MTTDIPTDIPTDMSPDIPAPRVVHRAPSVSSRAAARIQSDVAGTVLAITATLAVCVCLVGAVAGFLPESTAIFWYVTPLRLVLALGLIALLALGNPFTTFATRLDPAFVLLLAAAGLATLRMESDLATWRWLLTLVVAYYLTVGVRRRWRHAGDALAATTLVVVACTSFVAFGQLSNPSSTGFCRDGFHNVPCGTAGAMVRVEGTFSNPNLLAAFLVLALPVAALAAWNLVEPAARLVGLAVVAAGLTALILTLGRAGMIGVLVDVLAVTSMMASQRRRLSMALRFGIVAALVVVTFLALAVGVGVRRDVWWAALAVAAHHPLGVGLGRAGVLISERIPGNEQFAHAHDLWLNWLVEAGVFGLLAVLAVTVIIALRLRSGARTGDPLTIAVAAGLAGFAVNCLVDDPANITAVALPMMVMLGLAATVATPPRGKRAARVDQI